MNAKLVSTIVDIVSNQVCEEGFIIIPSFGSFFVEYQSAFYDEKRGIFFPPRHVVQFNSRIQYNDGELAIRLSKKLKINYFDALKQIDDFVFFIKYELNTNNEFIFGNLGKFIFKGNSLIFRNNDEFYTPPFYGLKPVFLSSNQLPETVIFSYPESKQRIVKNLIKAAVVVPLIVAISLIPTKTNFYNLSDAEAGFMNKKPLNVQVDLTEQNLERVIDTLTNMKIALTPSVQAISVQTDSTDLENKREKEKTQSETRLETKQVPGKTDKYYYVIIASFTTAKQVETFKQSLKDIENDLIILNCEGRLRVAYRSYSSRHEANEALKQLKEEFPHLNGWILYW